MSLLLLLRPRGTSSAGYGPGTIGGVSSPSSRGVNVAHPGHPDNAHTVITRPNRIRIGRNTSGGIS